jgi:HEAT repeat protein
MEALSKLGSVDDVAISALVRALADDGVARVKAAEVLGRMGPPAKSAVPALTDLLRESDPEACVQAALALWRIDRRTEETVPVLLSALKGPWTPRPGSALSVPGRFGAVSSAPPACQQAADALGQMGTEARAAVPALTELLRDPQFFSYRPSYALALFKIDRQAAGVAVAALIGVFDCKGHVTRLSAQAASALRKQAVSTLEQIGGEARDAIPALASALADADAGVRQGAAKALGAIGAPAREAVPSLRKALMDPDEAVRSQATLALRKIGA